jgi:gamma-glutamyltranspeptidase/glutathione hydrolase
MAAQFDWAMPYSSGRAPVVARNMVATTQPLAAQAGLRMLQQGGNAVDAAVAAAIALTVVEPISGGMGGDAFAILWDGGRVRGLNGSGCLPLNWRPTHRQDGAPLGDLLGWESVTTPGVVSAWAALSQEHGRLPFHKLFEPAIGYARDGFHVSPMVARIWKGLQRVYQPYPEILAAFFPEGRAPEAGSVFRFPALADTFEVVASTRGHAFYRGDIAEKIVAHAAAAGAALSAADLAVHRAEWVEPLRIRYRDTEVYELPPNCQGLVTLIALGILENFELSRYAVDTADSIHLQLEAVKLGFADTHAHLADPRFMGRGTMEFLDPSYLRRRAKQISLAEARCPDTGLPSSGGTACVIAADKDGMIVSYIHSNGRGFGAGIVVPETGITMQNRARAFSDRAGHPNEIGPGKRPYHTNIPALALRDGRPLMAFGCMGWTMQPQAHVQFVTRLVDYRQQPQAVLDAPRWRLAVAEPAILLEPRLRAAAATELARRGHDIVDTETKFELATTPFGSAMMFGAGQIICALGDGYVGASDHRRDGQVAGY